MKRKDYLGFWYDVLGDKVWPFQDLNQMNLDKKETIKQKSLKKHF